VTEPFYKKKNPSNPNDLGSVEQLTLPFVWEQCWTLLTVPVYENVAFYQNPQGWALGGREFRRN
jgi:hypothetical protein